MFAGIGKKAKESDDSSSDSEDSSDNEETTAAPAETAPVESLISTDPASDLDSIMGTAPQPAVQFDPLAAQATPTDETDKMMMN